MSTQEFLLEEIKHQPEPVLLQLRDYLDFLKRQSETRTPMENLVADTWEKLFADTYSEFGPVKQEARSWI